MTSASKARIARRSAEKAIANKLAFKPGDPAKSVITLTEVPGTPGGFTIGLGLHGARMEELFPNTTHPLSVVDVLAMAVATVIRKQPKDFQDIVALVSQTLRDANEQIAAGGDVDTLMSAVDDTLGGTIGDVEASDEAPSEEEPGYDEWLRAKVTASLNDPRPAIPGDEVEAHFAARRAGVDPHEGSEGYAEWLAAQEALLTAKLTESREASDVG